MAISFSARAKAEMCDHLPQKRCCAVAQCFGILLFSNCFGSDGIRITTESRELAQLLPRLFKKAFSLEFDLFPSFHAPGKLTFSVTDPDKIRRIMDTYGFEMGSTLSLHINLAVVEDECCRSAFVRGAFLAGGSVTDPEKGYHLEFATGHRSVAREGFTLIGEIMGFDPKLTGRGGCQVLYVKQCDQVSDMLTFLGAPVAATCILEARLEKELNNRVNRRCNCDDANTSKVVEAAQEQLSAIRILRERGLLEHMPKKLLQAAIARENNPESSLTELAAIMEPPISKPAMNHRLKRLVEMAREDTL